ncbi:uncharacterized protein Dvir_GJ21002 [Drosophila virilis]|uniref:c-SKI SMAD4-binding domain-containing protein n=1 Tax=Drosophila virilis TaxID=7244 RepID=B4MEY4_DROVI|nr:uncharacterized protein Dvir_GJ21002 [Drosophila virilis]
MALAKGIPTDGFNNPVNGKGIRWADMFVQTELQYQGTLTGVDKRAWFMVSSVLLYGIPIVSLYIEGQERLCLAQISNTLLKQFSYNEIHNRRVALGITCVQCTPVQLEILRRAGAMPVSSRRCGMITRREAERLCKSFLGDNTPPRLPDDFAFSVQHKCAWGCRGLFLPARYNSSRAKCIKCTYCGMFFSPNKFIFHSHRITTNDRYIQPDAANFNSWRRHMTLSSHAQDEKIIHAWEDVKAMFNGGTRKRLVGCNNNHRSQSSPGSVAYAVEENACDSRSPDSCETDTKPRSLHEETLCSKRTMNHQYNYSTVAAAAAVVGVTAVAATVGVPFNLHRSSVLSPLQSLRNEQELSIVPLSRNFVVDYTMWQQQNQTHSKKISGSEATNGSVCPWIRPDLNVLSSAGNAIPLNVIKNEPRSGASYTGIKNRKVADGDQSDFNMSSILSSSAFKPVVASASIMSTSLYATRSNDSISNVYISPSQSTRTTTVFTHNSITAASTQRLPSEAILNTATCAFPPILNSIQLSAESLTAEHLNTSTLSDPLYINTTICRNPNGDDDNDDDDEVVDIETTEDDLQTIYDSRNLFAHSPNDISSVSASHSHSGSPNDDVDVDGITTDVEDQIDFKSNNCSYDINISRSNLYVHHTTEKDKRSSQGMNTEEEGIRTNHIKNNEDANGSKRLSRRKCSNQQSQRQYLKKNGPTLDTDKLFSTQPSLHIPQRVTFPVFLRSHLNSFRQRHHRQPSPNTPRQLYCCDTTARSNENGVE